jgi:uncharacterized protein (DUF305 family)
MELKNNPAFIGLVFVLIGIFLGWLIWGTNRGMSGMHRMPNGEMMHNMQGNDMGGMMYGMMSGLEGKTGDEFDKAFLSEMIVHHQGAVEMAQAVLKNSKRPELVKLANDIITAQTNEIDMMKNWQKEWFNQ